MHRVPSPDTVIADTQAAIAQWAAEWSTDAQDLQQAADQAGSSVSSQEATAAWVAKAAALQSLTSQLESFAQLTPVPSPAAQDLQHLRELEQLWRVASSAVRASRGRNVDLDQPVWRELALWLDDGGDPSSNPLEAKHQAARSGASATAHMPELSKSAMSRLYTSFSGPGTGNLNAARLMARVSLQLINANEQLGRGDMSACGVLRTATLAAARVQRRVQQGMAYIDSLEADVPAAFEDVSAMLDKLRQSACFGQAK